VIALDKVCNASTHLDDDAGSLVTHHERSRMGPLALLQMKIAMAHTRAGDFNFYFAWAGWGKVDFDNFDGLIG